MIKAFVFIASLFALPAFAACPSIDSTIRFAKAGMATTIDVERAILCQIEGPCSLRIAILGNVVLLTERRFNAGDVTVQEMRQVEEELTAEKQKCEK